MSPPERKLQALPEFCVRPMSASDVRAAHAVLMESPEASIWSEDSLRQSASGGIALMAELDGSIAGILVGRVAADEFEIQNLAVAKALRRRGIATQLVTKAMANACRAGAKQVYLEVRASNQAAITFYAGMGFRECGRRSGYYRDPVEDAVLLVFHNSEQKPNLP